MGDCDGHCCISNVHIGMTASRCWGGHGCQVVLASCCACDIWGITFNAIIEVAKACCIMCCSATVSAAQRLFLLLSELQDGGQCGLMCGIVGKLLGIEFTGKCSFDVCEGFIGVK